MRAALIATLLAFISFLASGAERLPNVILILADDLGYADVGCFQAEGIRTPNIDRLATEGTRFTSFYVAQAVCTASRAAIMTGCYANRVGMSGALNHTSANGIAPSEVLLSDLFKRRGYATAIHGKWHLGHHPPFLPTKRGFDEWSGIPYSNDNGPLHPVAKNLPALPWYENEQVVELDPDQSQFTERITKRCVDFITRNRDQPFFLYVPHIMPHVPIFPSSRFAGKSGRGRYGDVVEELDWSVGEIMRAVAAAGIDDHTLILFTSDNGPFISYGEHAGRATPLREGKLTSFEGGVRVPALARWPGRIPAGRVCDELVTAIDLYATFAALIGAEVPPGKRDTIDLSPLLLGQPKAQGREEFWYYAGDELQAVRSGRWKLHVPHRYLTVAAEPGVGGKPSNHGKGSPQSLEQSGIYGIASRHGYRVEQIGEVLYDLVSDPGEQHDVAQANPEVVQRLRALVAAARADLGDENSGVPASQARAAGDVRPKLPAGVRVVANQVYADPPRGALLLDLYLPQNQPSEPMPVVVWIHGGGWSGGAKEQCPLVFLAAQGVAVASINNRLTQVAQWPAQLDDARAAVRWLRTQAVTYGLDPKRILAAGGSAGGHLAAVLGTTPAITETISSRVQGVIDCYGPSDLLTMPPNVAGPGRDDAALARSNGAKLLGGIVRDRPELARQASALHLVSADDPPFLILHGDQDEQVPLDQSQRLDAALKAAGVVSTLVVLPGAGHGGKAFSAADIQQRIADFVRAQTPR
jgi:arylsulfatase